MEENNVTIFSLRGLCGSRLWVQGMKDGGGNQNCWVWLRSVHIDASFSGWHEMLTCFTCSIQIQQDRRLIPEESEFKELLLCSSPLTIEA